MAKNNKTRFFYVLYSDKTRVFDQSGRAYYPIYIINIYIKFEEIEDISELHLLNKYCLVLNQKKKPIYCKIKCGER